MPQTPSNLRRAGLIGLDLDGETFDVVGNVVYSLGKAVREGLPGADRMHGYRETPGTPFAEMSLRDGSGVDLADLVTRDDSTLQLLLSNGKTFVLEQCWQAGTGEVSSESGEISARFEGMAAEEIITP